MGNNPKFWVPVRFGSWQNLASVCSCSVPGSFSIYTVKLKRSFFNLRTDVLVALRYSAELWSSDSGFESQQVCL